jgi:hypothetical protein
MGASGEGLELLELTAHRIDGLVELLHPLLQKRVDRGSCRCGLEGSPALVIGWD